MDRLEYGLWAALLHVPMIVTNAQIPHPKTRRRADF
jgi:hypothetical protein